MVVMRTRSERQLRPVHETGKVSAVPLWQGSGPQLTSLVATDTWTHDGRGM